MKKYWKQTRNILNWELRQRDIYIAIGIWIGAALFLIGAILGSL